MPKKGLVRVSKTQGVGRLLQIGPELGSDVRVLREPQGGLGRNGSLATDDFVHPGYEMCERSATSRLIPRGSKKSSRKTFGCVASPDIRWIVGENLKKQRLMKMDPLWTARLADPLT